MDETQLPHLVEAAMSYSADMARHCHGSVEGEAKVVNRGGE
jgi:hypothetical protein